LGGQTTTAGLGTIQHTGGTLSLWGAVDNTNSTLDFGALNITEMRGPIGTITGGTVLGNPNGTLFRHQEFLGGSPRLDGVVFNGNFASSDLAITGGFALNGTATVSGNGTIGFLGNQTITAGTFVTNNGTFGLGPGTLTLSPQVVVQGNIGGFSGIQWPSGPALLRNQGTIQLAGAGRSGQWSVDFENSGLMEVSGGASLIVSSSSWSNSGIMRIGTSSSLDLRGSFSLANGTFENS